MKHTLNLGERVTFVLPGMLKGIPVMIRARLDNGNPIPSYLIEETERRLPNGAPRRYKTSAMYLT